MEKGKVVRYFIKSRNGEDVAVIKFTVENKNILDQFWNPTLENWEDGSFGMNVILGKDFNSREVSKDEVYQKFPGCPL